MNNLTKLNTHGIPDAPKDAVAFWDNMAAQFARGAVASQVMCGFALLELKKESGVKHGGNHMVKGASPNVFGFASWPAFIEATYGFSDETARNRIKMAEGVRSDFKKLGLADRFKNLLLTHPSEWSETDTKMFSEALHKVTSGMTQADFFCRLGLTTGAGRNDNPTPGKRGLSDDEKAALADPLLEIENDLVSITDENDTTFADVASARLAKFSQALKACHDRAEAILKSRRAK